MLSCVVDVLMPEEIGAGPTVGLFDASITSLLGLRFQTEAAKQLLLEANRRRDEVPTHRLQ